MAEALKTAMPPDLDLPDGYVLQWAAIDPLTGADITGVVVSGVSIFGTMLGSLASPNVADPILIGASL